MKYSDNSPALHEGMMKNRIARANPITNASKISPRKMIQGWESQLSSAKNKIKKGVYVKKCFIF